MKTKKLGLAAKTFIGFGLGIVIGLVFKEKASVIKPLGTIFLNMIKMLVVPMVFFSITAGVASLGDLRKLRNIGVKVVGLYAITSAISVGIGLLVANMINPGKGFDMTALSGAAEYEAQGMPSVLDTLIDMFPTNVVQSFANQNMLQIIVFSIFLGVALIMLEERGKHLADTFQSLADVMYKITAIVMEFSPIGVCAPAGRFRGRLRPVHLRPSGQAHPHGLRRRCHPCFGDVYPHGGPDGQIPPEAVLPGHLEGLGHYRQHHQLRRFPPGYNLRYQ